MDGRAGEFLLIDSCLSKRDFSHCCFQLAFAHQKWAVYGGAVMDATEALITGLWLFCSIHSRPDCVTLGQYSRNSFCRAGSSASLAKPKLEMATPDRSSHRKLCISLMNVKPALLMPGQQQMVKTCRNDNLGEASICQRGFSSLGSPSSNIQQVLTCQI